MTKDDALAKVIDLALKGRVAEFYRNIQNGDESLKTLDDVIKEVLNIAVIAGIIEESK